MGRIPDSPDEIAFIVWIAALAAGYDAGNAAKPEAVLDLFTKVLDAVNGIVEPQHDQTLH